MMEQIALRFPEDGRGKPRDPPIRDLFLSAELPSTPIGSEISPCSVVCSEPIRIASDRCQGR
jgi:hypothetical protein